MLSAHKLSQTCKTPILGCFVYGMTCAQVTCSVDYLWGELMKIGTTCAGTTCVLGLLVTGSLWTLGRLVRGQHVIWDFLSQGGHEHWGQLSKGGVVQGRIKVISSLQYQSRKLCCTLLITAAPIWATMHPLVYAAPTKQCCIELLCTILSCSAPSELLCTLLSLVASFWATLPSGLGWTLLSYAAP